MEKLLNKNSFDSLITGLKKQGYKTIAPKKDNKLVTLEEIQDANEISLDHVITNNSIKEFFFPKTEKPTETPETIEGMVLWLDEVVEVEVTPEEGGEAEDNPGD